MRRIREVTRSGDRLDALVCSQHTEEVETLASDASLFVIFAHIMGRTRAVMAVGSRIRGHT